MSKFAEFEVTCPNCGTIQQAHSSQNADSAVPEPGNIAICFDCLSICIYDHSRNLREPTEAEKVEVMADATFVRTMTALIEFRNKEESP